MIAARLPLLGLAIVEATAGTALLVARIAPDTVVGAAVLYPLANSIAFHSAAELASDFAHVGLGSPKINKIGQLLAGATPGPANAVKSGVVYASTVINSTQIYPLRNVPADGQAWRRGLL